MGIRFQKWVNLVTFFRTSSDKIIYTFVIEFYYLFLVSLYYSVLSCVCGIIRSLSEGFHL